MTVLVPLALLAFVPLTVWSFRRLGPARGAEASLLAGTLFLPNFDFGYVPLLRGKEMFVPAVILAAIAVADRERWRNLRAGAVDVPVAAFCALPAATALSNGLSSYEAASAAFEASLIWGAPWFFGRVYAGTPRGIRDWASVFVTAGLVYVPLCLWEVRMSPQLHRTLYGFHQHAFVQHMRDGGYRPMVFMTHGLMVATFMASATLIAFWMLRTGVRRRLAGVWMGWVTAALAAATILCKSAGAMVLLAAGIAALEASRRLRTSALVLVLLAVPWAYGAARMSGWSASEIVDASARWINPERAQSLLFRLTHESRLVARAKQQLWLGWGRFGRSRVYDESGSDVTVTDGYWVIVLGVGGLASLFAVGLVLTSPGVAILRSFPAFEWDVPRLGVAAVLVVLLALSGIDLLFNAMLNPFLPFTAGALASFARRGSAAATGRRSFVRDAGRGSQGGRLESVHAH
jgi:hypothetical protein